MKRIIFTIIGLILLLSIALTFTLKISKSQAKKYNETFPEEYISETHPDCEIISHHAEGDNIITARCEKYLCYDTAKHFAFIQNFKYEGTLSKLSPDDERNSRSYNSMMNYRESFDRCIEIIPEYYSGDYFTRYNPDNISGILIFTKLDNTSSLQELVNGLNESIDEERTLKNNYISYSIYFCSEELYTKLENYDYESIVRSETYMDSIIAQLGIDAVELMSGKKFEDKESFELKEFSDKNILENDVIFIHGEPNSTGHQIIRIFSEK